MKDLLEKIKAFNRVPIESEVDAYIDAFDPDTPIALLEEVVKHFKAARKKILTGDLLEWMQENDQTLFENEDIQVKIVTYVKAGIDKENPDAVVLAFKWLDNHEYGDLIKDTLDLAKGEFTEEVRNSLAELGVSYTQKTGIHPQSLKKVMSDRLKAEEDLPTEDDGFEIDYYDMCDVKAL